MRITYQTVVIGEGNHASFEIPDVYLSAIGGNRRAPLKITINGHTYQSTATGVGGKCMVVFPTIDRQATGASAGDGITVTLQLDEGYRRVDIPVALNEALHASKLNLAFSELTYYQRKLYAKQVNEAKTPETRNRRILKIISALQAL